MDLVKITNRLTFAFGEFFVLVLIVGVLSTGIERLLILLQFSGILFV